MQHDMKLWRSFSLPPYKLVTMQGVALCTHCMAYECHATDYVGFSLAHVFWYPCKVFC